MIRQTFVLPSPRSTAAITQPDWHIPSELGHIDKTLHILTYINDEDKRIDTLIQH